MALNSIEIKNFKLEILRASIDLNSNILEYESDCTFDLPGHDLRINGESILYKYNIPTGWNGFGSGDLEKLENSGFLKRIEETEEDPITFEKRIVFMINPS